MIPSPHWVRVFDHPGGKLRLGREGVRIVAEWEGIGTLRATPWGSDVEVDACAGLVPAYERKWRNGPVKAMLRHLGGSPTLHASAVSIEGRGLILLGDSGAGKSTSAADLCLRGAELIADDLVEMTLTSTESLAQPTETEHWLLPDSSAELGHPGRQGGGKVAWRSPRVARGPVPTAAFVVLAFAQDHAVPALQPLRGEATFSALNAGFVRFLVDDSDVLLRDLDTLARLVQSAPSFTLSRPRSLEALDGVARVLQDLFPSLAVARANR